MATFTTEPTYIVPNKSAGIVFALDESGANYMRAWVTDAPEGSELKAKLTDNGITETQVYEGDGESTWDFTPDVGGCYRVKVQEYTLGASSHGGSYQGDPNGVQSETKKGTEYSLSLYVGQKLTSSVGAGGDLADLVLYVFDDTIRETTLAIHGEVTPRIELPATPRARSAMVAPAVESSLLDLIDVTAATAIGDPSSIVSDIVTNYNLHRVEPGVHNTDDTDNVVSAGFGSSLTPETMSIGASEIMRNVRNHYSNDDGTGPATKDYHGSLFDLTNPPLFLSVGGTADSYRSIADLWRSYEAHRVFGPVHGSPDTTNTLAALPVLLVVHREFLASLAALTPVVPQTQSTGAVLLMAQTGARES